MIMSNLKEKHGSVQVVGKELFSHSWKESGVENKVMYHS
jgi:hypothetical protein